MKAKDYRLGHGLVMSGREYRAIRHLSKVAKEYVDKHIDMLNKQMEMRGPVASVTEVR